MPPDNAYCPHCRRLLAARAPHPYPSRPMRCPQCRLMVGPGRSLTAEGRPRRVSAHVDTLPVDAVLDVLRDAQSATRPSPFHDLGI